VRIVFHREAREVVVGPVVCKCLLLCLVLLPSLVATSECAGDTDASYRPTDEISQKRLPRDILYGKVEPNEPGPEEPTPIEVWPVALPVLDRALRRTSFDIGLEVYSFKYKEPGVMEEEGVFCAVRLGYTSRDWVSSSPQESPPDGGMMFRAEARLALGQVDYDGGSQDLQTGEISPLTVDNIDDFAIEGRLLLGADRLGGEMLNTLYTGIGYRYLNDDLSSAPGGYERESNYYYVPIGYEIDANLRADWSWVGRIEFDYLLWGLQRSHVYPVLENRQNSGHGYRASIKLQKKSQDVMFVIEPFFRYWDIDKSEVEPGGFEPKNETTEYGIQLVWMF